MRAKIITLVALGVSVFFLAFSFSAPATRTQTYFHGLRFDHYAEIENNALTPPPTMSADTYFENITENIVVSLRYVPPPPNSPKMERIKLPENDSKISIILKGRGWEKTIENGKVPSGSWKRKFNIRSLYRRAETIDDSLGLNPGRDHALIIKASLEPTIKSSIGTSSDRIEHSLKMEMGSEAISVEGPLEKMKSERTERAEQARANKSLHRPLSLHGGGRGVDRRSDCPLRGASRGEKRRGRILGFCGHVGEATRGGENRRAGLLGGARKSCKTRGISDGR